MTARPSVIYIEGRAADCGYDRSLLDGDRHRLCQAIISGICAFTGGKLRKNCSPGGVGVRKVCTVLVRPSELQLVVTIPPDRPSYG